MPASENTFDYARRSRGVRTQDPATLIALTLLILALYLLAWFAAHEYTARRYGGITSARYNGRGMTRAQVDRHLSAFTSRQNTRYQGAGPGRSVVRYELLRFGKSATIQIIYEPDGTVWDAQPVFDN
jgi:hypothetical protein